MLASTDIGDNSMKIAVLSGKGGTGKTLVSVNLASIVKNSTYIDCDVEEPNGHLFFKPEEVKTKEVKVKIPVVDQDTCNGCRKCVEFCKFNALAYINDKLIIFDEICHSCGGCMLVCPENAISERDKTIGKIEEGMSEDVTAITGILNMGEASGVPIIGEILDKDFEGDETVVIDSPPGSACIVMESIKDVDYCILVAEPTVFGVHNLDMVYELVKLFDKPHGVVLNKCLDGKNPAEEYCIEKDIKILGRIAYYKELGTLNSNGLIASRDNNKYKDLFSNILNEVTNEFQNVRIVNPYWKRWYRKNYNSQCIY